MSFTEKEAVIVDKIINLFTSIRTGKLSEKERETIRTSILTLFEKVFPDTEEKREETNETWVI